MTQRIVSQEDHRRFAVDALTAAGATGADAAIVAQALLWSDIHGRHTNGLIRLPNMLRRITCRLINSPAAMTWTTIAPSAHLLDANHGLGHVVGCAAMERAIRIGKLQGIGLVVVKQSNHYGAASYYCSLATEAGCLGLTGTNAYPKVAPYGGTRPALGTNPLAFGCPTKSVAPILVDFSTSAVSGGEVRSSKAESAPLPQGVAVDAEGRPTTEPAAANSGCLLPAAGPKGFGLALLIEILTGILTAGAMGKEVGSLFHTWDRPVNTGHVFLAIDIERFMPMEAFVERVHTLIGWIKESPPQEGFEEIRYPGEIRARYAEKYAREGIPLNGETVQALENIADTFNVKLPW